MPDATGLRVSVGVRSPVQAQSVELLPVRCVRYSHLSPFDIAYYKGHLCQSGVKNVIIFGKNQLKDVSEMAIYRYFDGFKSEMWQRCGGSGVSEVKEMSSPRP